MWEMTRQVGSSKYYVYKDRSGIERIKFKVSAFKDDSYKITFLSYLGDESFTKRVKVKEGTLEEIQKSALEVFKKLKQQEVKFVNSVKRANKKYRDFFNKIKDSNNEE